MKQNFLENVHVHGLAGVRVRSEYYRVDIAVVVRSLKIRFLKKDV